MKFVRRSILVGFSLVLLGILVMTNRRDTDSEGLGTIEEASKEQLIENQEPAVELSRRPLSLPASNPELVAAEEKPGILEGLNDPKGSIEADLAMVDNLLFSYYSVFQEYPYGENTDWIQAFLGANKRRIAFLAKDANWLDGKGQLVDRWGAPFFFHRLSGSRIEIRSAGPDGVHWTGDDHSSIEAGSTESSTVLQVADHLSLLD